MSLLLALTTSSGGAISYTMSCASGSYSYNGTAASFIFGRRFSAGSGSYSYAGTSATFALARKLSLATGSYAYTGTSATLTATINTPVVNYILNCASGSYSVTGTPAKGMMGFDMIIGPTAAEIAAAILLAAQTTPIYADAREMNGAQVIGDGTAGNDWRGVGVPPTVV